MILFFLAQYTMQRHTRYSYLRVSTLARHLEVGESLVIKDRLSHNTSECHHRKSAVCNFLKLGFLNFCLRLASKVFRSKSEVTGGASRSLKHLGDTNPRSHLGNANPDQDVSKSSIFDGSIMDGGRGGSRHGLGVARDAQSEVDSDVSNPRELTHAAVLELGLAEVVGGEVVRDAEGVESDITNVSLEVNGVGEEGERLGLFNGKAGGGTAWNGWEKGGFLEGKDRWTRYPSNRRETGIILPVEAGAKAAAEPTRAASTAVFIMVIKF